MICVISDTLKEKFLSKIVGDVLAAARSGQPFSTEAYVKDIYKQILDRTADRAKAQTFASFIPGNLISIFAANKEAGKYLTPSIAELATLRETFEDFDSVGTYLGIGQEAAQTKKQEVVEANESSLRVEEDPTAGASPAVVAGTAQPTNKSSISTSFKAAGKSALTAFNVVKPDADPIVVASQNFSGKYHQAQKNGSAEYQGLKLKVVPARSIIADLPQRERDFLENTPSYEGVKAILVNADNTPVRIDSQGNIAEEGVLAQYMLNRPELVDGVFVRKTETPISEVASALGVDESVAQEARQKEYRILYNIRKALEQDPNREIYVGISASAGFSVNMQQDNPISLGDIDFKALGEEFIPFVDGGTGKAFFELSFAKDPLPIDRPGITSVIPAETLAKYIFDESIPLVTRKEVFENLLYTKDIKLREGQILYKDQPVTEDVIASVLKSVTESARGSVNSTYRANVPLNTATTVDIPYYDQNGKVQYNTLDAVDYLKKYFTTPAKLEETTSPYFNLDITPEEQVAFQANVEELSEQTSKAPVSTVKQGVAELFESNSELANAAYEAAGFKLSSIDLTPSQEYSIKNYQNIPIVGIYHYISRDKNTPVNYKVTDVSEKGILVVNQETKKEKLFTEEEYYKTFNIDKDAGFSVLGKFGFAEVYKYTELQNGTPVYSLELSLFNDKDKGKGLGKDIYKAALQEINKRNGVLTPGAVVKGNKVWESFERDGLLEEGIISNGETIVILNPNKVQAKISTQAPVSTVKPENISSKGSEFAKKLTNVGNTVGVTYKGKQYVNSEHAYQTWKSGEFNQAGYDLKGGKVKGGKIGDTFAIMTDILTEKLKQHPDLVQGINKRGGLAYIQQSTHNVIGDKFWESAGQNKFIEALAKAYQNVSTQIPVSANKARPVGLQLDLDAITADIANKLKENIISNGLGATFNIQESIDSDITETISKGKQNSCK